MENIWRFIIKKCVENEFGGIVIADDEDSAKQKIKEKYGYNALEDNIVVWKVSLDDDYDEKYPDILEIYG